MENTYIKVVPETELDREALEMLLRIPEEAEVLGKYITRIKNSSYEQLETMKHKGINLILERVTMIPS